MRLGLAVPPTLAIELLDSSSGVGQQVHDWLEDASDNVSSWALSKGLHHLVIRSSGQSEDSDGSSFAGLFPSRFCLASRSAIHAALRDMLQGQSSKALDAYIQAKGINQKQSMSFLVQPTIPPIRSGVAFAIAGRNLIDLVVQGTWGLALDLVRGVAGGDIYDSRRSTGLALTTGAKSLAVYPLVLSGQVVPGDHIQVSFGQGVSSATAKLVFVDESQALGYVRIPAALQSRPAALTSEVVTALRTQLTHAVDQLAVSLDVEWVQAIDGRIYIVQMRPVTADLITPDLPLPSHRDTRKVFSGEPGAPGTFAGLVWRWTDQRTPLSPASDEVLVCGPARPEMLPEILQSGALVSSEAGILSHVAILARELGKPCVLGASTLPSWIKDGAAVVVDGTSGTVESVHQADSAVQLERLDELCFDEVEIALWPESALEDEPEQDPTKRTLIALLTHEWLEALQRNPSLYLRLFERKTIVILHVDASASAPNVMRVLNPLGFLSAEWGSWSIAVHGISIGAAKELLHSLGLPNGS